MTGVEHVPERPSWACATCRKPWPCSPARERMVAETRGGLTLALLMTGYLEDFGTDQAAAPVAAAYRRFLGWLPR
jgi:hypothetical protein